MNSALSGKEKIKTLVFDDPQSAIIDIAKKIGIRIRDSQKLSSSFVLGLATGSTPKSLYKELIRLHQDEGLSFRNVVTFNLDEYFPMSSESEQSYVRFMNEQLFDHIDISRENINIPNGQVSPDQIEDYCKQYEDKIELEGGIDIQILGIGRTGHIGFNEPGSSLNSKTRLVTLDNLTRVDATSDFHGFENVPRTAITMGINSILKADEIIIMAWGESKASIVREAVEDAISEQVPATFLQAHVDCTFFVDSGASSELTRIKSPWLVGECVWSQSLERKAIVWLCQKVGKPILKLTDRDYLENGMGDLLTKWKSSYDLNINLFNYFQRTITGWPGGKPNADDTHRPERSLPSHKRVVIFSPHPDDDVISMGGTFSRLHQQEHEVHVAYQTSGDIAVFDHEVVRFLDFFKEFDKELGSYFHHADHLYEQALAAGTKDYENVLDDEVSRKVKAIIRRGEARAGCRSVGVSDDRAHFLNLPFYQTGQVQKNPPGDKDISITCDLLNRIKPHQIYAAGDLSDPHGTHRVCLDIVFKSLELLKESGAKWLDDCYVWLYRGAWQEWDINDIEMAVPLSPDEVLNKRRAIFKHQSQKDTPVFPGSDAREFWQRAEDRNRGTASLYDKLGLPEYEAMEAFKRYRF